MIWWVRLGRAELRRHKVRSALIVAFVAVPVLAMTVAAVLVASRGPSTGLSVAISTSSACASQPARPGPTGACDPGVVAAAAAAIPDSVPHGLGSLGEVFVERQGQVESLTLGELDLPEQVFGPVSILREGRYPTASGEVALTRAQLELTETRVGQTLRLGVPPVDLRIVGEITATAGAPGLAASGTFVASPSDGSERANTRRADGAGEGLTEWRAPTVFSLIDIDTDTLDQLEASGAGVAGLDPDQISTWFFGSYSDSADNSLALVPLVGTAALFWLGLVAATGLAIGARRRRREFGLLVANGADPGQLRLAALSEALVLGAVGAVLGAGFGLVAANRWTPWAQYRLDLVADTVVVPWVTVLLCAALGVAAATIAGDAATRALRRQTPSELLRGTPLPTRPARRWFLAGAVCWAVAAVAIASWHWSWRGGNDLTSTFISAQPGGWPIEWRNEATALVAMVGVAGLVAIVVGLTRLLGRLTDRLPVTWRLAGADLSRHGARVATATAAISLTLGGAAWAGAAQSAQLSPERAAIDSGFASGSFTSVPLSRLAIVDGELIDRPVADVAAVASELAELGVAPLVVDQLRCASWLCDWITPVAVGGADVDPTAASERLEQLSPTAAQVLDRGVVAVPGYATSFITDSDAVESTPGADGGVDLQLGDLTVPIEAVTGLGDRAIVPESLLAELGLERTGAQSLLVPAIPPELAGEANAVLVAAGAPMTLYDLPAADDTLGVVMAVVALVIAALALLIAAMALGLLRAESVEEDRSLAEVGAAPLRRRSVHAARGALVMWVAAVPATTAAAYLTAIDGEGPVLGLPWWVFGVVLVALPAAAWVTNLGIARPARWDSRAAV